MAGIEVTIGADTSGFDAGVSRTKKQVTQLSKEFRSGAIQAAKYGAAAVAAGAAIAAGLTAQGLKAVDAQAKLARQLDATIDGLRATQIAASDAGISMGVIQSAAEKLNQRLGEAQRGTGTAADSLDRLGLSADRLADLDVDQRFAVIADRMRELGLSSSQAADELRQMGIRNTELVNLMLQGGDAIRAARQEVVDLGLSLSEVDAAKVEMANDSFARFGLLLDGIRQQLAVEVAPVINAISRMLTDASKEAGGFGEATSDAMGFVVDSAAFVVDAIEGIRRVISITGKIIAGFGFGAQDVFLTIADSIINGPVDAARELIEVMNQIPGVDIESPVLSDLGSKIRQSLVEVRAAQEMIMDDIRAELMEPLPGMQFKEFVAESKANAEAAAKEIVGIGGMLRQSATGGAGRGQATTEGGESESDQQEALQRRIEQIRQANMSEVALLNEKFAMENEALNAAREQQLITEEEWFQLSREQKERQEGELTELEQQAADARNRIAEQEAQFKRKALGDALSSLSTLMNSESKKMFEVGKAAALAQALVDGKAAIVGAYKVGASIGGPALGAAYGAAAGLATFQQIQAIRSASFGGGGSTGGSSGGAVSNTQAVNAQTQPVLNVALQGFDPSKLVSMQEVGGLLDALQDEAQNRGLNLLVSR